MSVEAPVAAPAMTAVGTGGPEMSLVSPTPISLGLSAIDGGSAKPEFSLRSVLDLPVYTVDAENFNPDRTVPVPEIVFSDKLFSTIATPKQQLEAATISPLSNVGDSIAAITSPANEPEVSGVAEGEVSLGWAPDAIGPNQAQLHSLDSLLGPNDIAPEVSEDLLSTTEPLPANTTNEITPSFWNFDLGTDTIEQGGDPVFALQARESQADALLTQDAILQAQELFDDNPALSEIFSSAFEQALLEKGPEVEVAGHGLVQTEEAGEQSEAVETEDEVVLEALLPDQNTDIATDVQDREEEGEPEGQEAREPIWDAYETKFEAGKPQDILNSRSTVAKDIEIQVQGSQNPLETAKMAISQLDKVRPLFSALKREVEIDPLAQRIDVELSQLAQNDSSEVVRVIDLVVSRDESKEKVWHNRFENRIRESQMDAEQLTLARNGASAMVRKDDRYWVPVGSRPQNQPKELERVA